MCIDADIITSNYTNSLSLAKQLEEILSEDISSVITREKTTFDHLVEPFNESLLLFGAGNLGRKVLKCLRQEGIEPLAFTDNNPELWNKSVSGLRVLSPQEAAQKFGQKAAFVVTIWHEGHRFTLTRQQLLELNCSTVVPCLPLFWKFPEKLLPHYCLDLPRKILQESNKVRKAFFLWEDDLSRSQYLAFLRWQAKLDFDGLPVPTDDIYLQSNIFRLLADEVLVDCGAYDGDTIRDFLQRRGDSFSKIIAIEPDPANFQRLEEYVLTLPENIKSKVILVQSAVGSRTQKMHFAATGTMASSLVDTGVLKVNCTLLDEILTMDLPCYIKMDIQGSEMEALTGAQKVIEQASAVWAITTEHRLDDLWRIPLFIQSLSSEYRFFLRSHEEEGFGVVCYAVPVKRLRF